MDLLHSISDFAQKHTTLVYVCVILVLGALTLLRVLHSLNVINLRRRTKVISRRNLESLVSNAPPEDSAASAQAQALSSIDRNTSVTRKLLVPLIVLGTLALASAPLLSKAPATMVSILIGVGTVILGVAARPLIENAMSGLVISSSRLVNLGDTVRIDDFYGTIEDISFSHTTIKLWDWRRYVVPNSKMLQLPILNYSVHDKYEWTHIEFTVSYEVDIKKVREIALAIPRRSEHFADYEDPQFWTMGMDGQGYVIWLAAWADTPSSAWYLRTDMREALIAAFQEHKIPVQMTRHEVISRAA